MQKLFRTELLCSIAAAEAIIGFFLYGNVISIRGLRGHNNSLCRKIGLVSSRFQSPSNQEVFKEIEYCENGEIKLTHTVNEPFLDWSTIPSSEVISDLIKTYNKNLKAKLEITEKFILYLLTAVKNPLAFERLQKFETRFLLSSKHNCPITIIEVSDFVNQIFATPPVQKFPKVALRIVSVIIKHLIHFDEFLEHLKHCLHQLIISSLNPISLSLQKNQILCIVPDAVSLKNIDSSCSERIFTVLQNIYYITHFSKTTVDFTKYLGKFIVSQIKTNFITTEGLINRLHVMSEYGL